MRSVNGIINFSSKFGPNHRLTEKLKLILFMEIEKSIDFRLTKTACHLNVKEFRYFHNSKAIDQDFYIEVQSRKANHDVLYQ